MATWSQIANDPDYLSLPDTEKRKVADGFYNKTIGADTDFQSLPDEEKQKVKFGFYTKSGFEPQSEAPKETFLQKLGQFAAPKIQKVSDTLGKVDTSIIRSPTFGPLYSGLKESAGTVLGGLVSEEQAGRFAENVGRRFPESKTAQVGAAALGAIGQVLSPVDLILPVVNKLRLLAKAPQAVKVAEIAKIQAQVEPKVFKAATEALSPDEFAGINIGPKYTLPQGTGRLAAVDKQQSGRLALKNSIKELEQNILTKTVQAAKIEDKLKTLSLKHNLGKKVGYFEAQPGTMGATIKENVQRKADEIRELLITGQAERNKILADINKSRFELAGQKGLLNRPLPPLEKPFTLQAGLGEQNRAALEAFRAKLPKGPEIPPRMAQEAVIGPKAAIPPVPAPVAPVMDLSPEQTMINAMKGFRKIRGNQNLLLAQERAKRFAEVERLGKSIPGEAGYDAKLKALGGPMGRVEFESIAPQVSKPMREALFQKIEDSTILTTADKVTAGRGLKKMLGEAGGAVPQDKELEYLAEVFSPEFMGAIPKEWTIGRGINTIGNLMKSMRATLDVSIPLRQGLFFIGRPKQWIPAFGNMYKYVRSEDAFNAATKRIQAMPRYKIMRESGLSLPKTEEVFLSDYADKIPGFSVLHKASKRAASGFLNDLRASVFNDLAGKAEALKLADPLVYKNIAKLVNAGSGRGSLGKLTEATSVLNQVLFSPQLLASRLQLLNPGFYYKLDPFTRKEALKSLLTTAAAGASVLGLAKLGGAEVGDDYRSADFGKIKIGNTRSDIWGGFQQPIVAAARLLSGEMVSSTTGKEFQLGEGYKATTRKDIAQRFIESKTSPIAAFANGLLKGQTNMGEKFDPLGEGIESFVPMLTEDMMDLYKEWGPMGLLMAIPGAHGVGSQTYADQVPVREITKTGAEKITWKQKPNVGGVIADMIRGTSESNIPESEQKTLVEKRKADTLESIEAGKVKAQVLETGQAQRFGNKIIYLEKGVIKTKDLSETPESKAVQSAESTAKGVSSELRYLGIPFTPTNKEAAQINKIVIADMDYKAASREQRRAMMNRFILLKQRGK